MVGALDFSTVLATGSVWKSTNIRAFKKSF
jgi:hypothetical protein